MGMNKGTIGAIVNVVAIIMAVVALIWNALIYTETETTLIVTVTTSTRVGWNEWEACVEETCPSYEFSEVCDNAQKLGADYGDINECKMRDAGRTWLGLNIIAMVALAASAGMVFMNKGSGNMGKGAAGAGAVCLAIAVIVFYAVADDTNYWDADDDATSDFGPSGYLDVFACVAAIVGAVLV